MVNLITEARKRQHPGNKILVHEDVLEEFCQRLFGSNPNSFTPPAYSDESYEILTHH